MIYFLLRPAARTRENAVALLIVLAFLVLLAGLTVAYLSRTTTDRQVAHGSFNDAKSDQLARSALEIIVADLKQEIVNGSTSSTVNNFTIYSPTSGANIIPVAYGTPTSGTPIPNLIRRSMANDSAIPAPAISSRASALSSTPNPSPSPVVARKGEITAARWNKHYLIPRISPTPTKDSDTTPTSSFTAPDWVFVTSTGPTPIPSPTANVVGRYAYAIYDEGGLLDANVAGYPSPIPSPATYVQTIGRKGSPPLNDLSMTGLSWSAINDLVGWRNFASAQPTGTFTNFSFDSSAAIRYMTAVLSNNTGFLTVNPVVWSNRTDQIFPGRQALLDFQRKENFSVDALQYLGTFSRELNRPNWLPTLNAVDMGAANNGAGNVYAYKDNAANASGTPINPNVANVRVSGAFTRVDGSAAVLGEALMKRRYLLTNISELATTTNSNIQRDFGLKWNSGQNRWDYVGASGSTVQTTIERLDQVATENREPNFFEVLKAVILNGSVGLGSGPSNTFVTADAKYYTTPNSADNQIIEIGANIIDSWDADNIPTFINFGGNEYAGIENLPYLNKLVFTPSFPAAGSGGYFDAWLVPSLWNPHQNATNGTGTVRIVLNGSGTYTATAVAGSISTTSPPISPLPSSMDVSVAAFASPHPPSDPSASPSATSGDVTNVGSPEQFYGFHYPFTTTTPNALLINQQNADSAYADFGTGGTSLLLQIAVGSPITWKTYQAWNIAATGHPLSTLSVKTNADFTATTKLVDPEYVALDPRTIRFGIWGSNAGGQTASTAKRDLNYGAEDSLDEAPPANRIEQITWSGPQGSSFTVSVIPANLSLYATNGTASNHYVDVDGVQRRGDWTTSASGTTAGSTIMYRGNSQDRPQILSAAFQSVAELGQVFRDQPWKTLNFTNATTGATAVSADAGLLDIFSLQDVPMTAGRTSINTRQSTVLAAILSKAAKNLTGTSIITSTQRDSIVTALTNLTVNGASPQPMFNKAELVTRLAADAAVTGLGNKEARECIVRAFSDACQTRTWNLMIDVIAQSGRYPPNASTLSDFVVEGEKRYWLHVAIDRFTGEVIDQQLEEVFE